MPRYKVQIEYEGTHYKGWQAQPDAKTVEGEIEAGLAQVLRQPVDIVGQGRTDSGVHAEEQTAHFDFPRELNRDKLLFALLGVLPRDIAVWDLQRVDPDFHARFDAVARQYRYQIVTRPSPLREHTAAMVLEPLDHNRMQECAQMVTGKHDFSGFTKPEIAQEDARCEISLSAFDFADPMIVYRIKANRFVHHMVRRLVGTMIRVGQGKADLNEFYDLLRDSNPRQSGHGAAAKGLILEEVEYGKS